MNFGGGEDIVQLIIRITLPNFKLLQSDSNQYSVVLA